MKYRIAMWACAGFIVASFWALYLFPSVATMSQQASALARLTCPIVLVTDHFHSGLRFWWVILANAATYAFIGLAAETVRQQFRHA